MKSLAIIVEQNSNLVKSLVSLRDLILDGKVPKEMELVIHVHECNRPRHERKHNTPDSSQAAAPIVGEKHLTLDIVLKRKASHFENGDDLLDLISVGNRFRDPLCYPLAFFDGCGSWHSKLSF